LSLNSILVPSSGILCGAWAGNSCDSTSTAFDVLFRNHETQIQRTPTTNGLLDVAHTFQGWDAYTSSFPKVTEQAIAAEGRILLVNWTPRDASGAHLKWADIRDGVYDASYVIPTARNMRDWGTKFFLVFHTEPNSSSTAQGGDYGTDAEYASAARHVHDVFAAQGASNVIWVFNPAGHSSTSARTDALYPGDAYVDWISWDPYASGGESLAYVMGTKYPLYKWATVDKAGAHDKPIMFPEWGVEESATGTSKAAFFDSVRTDLATLWPGVKGVFYFNSTATTGDCVNTSTAALTAYRRLVADPTFNPDLSSSPPPPSGGSFIRDTAAASFVNSASKQITVPATAQSSDSMLLWHTCTRSELRQAMEGTNAAAVTVGNSGAKGSNPMDGVSATPPVYDTAAKHSGLSSWLAALAADTTHGGYWQDRFGSPATYWGELFIDPPVGAPAAAARLFQQGGALGSPAFQWGLVIDTDGKLKVRTSAGTNAATSAAALATAAFHRVEWQYDYNGSTVTVTVRLYSGANLDGLTLSDSFTTATPFAQAAAGGRYWAGALTTAAATYAPHVDGFRLSKSGWIGPEGVSPAITGGLAGWTLERTQQAVDGPVELISRLYRKPVGAGDPGSTLTITTDCLAHGGIDLVVIAGADPLAPVDLAASNAKTTDSATVTTPSVGPTSGAGEWVLQAAMVRDNPGAATTSWTLPAGAPTQRCATFPSGVTDGRVATVVADDGATHGVGTYGGAIFTQVGATSYLGIGWAVAIKPATATSSGASLGMMSYHN
jgi:hypothetical protein